MQALLQTPTLDVPAPGQQQQPDGQEIRFEDVSYAYGPEHQALSNLNFTLAPGTVTAVVGRRAPANPRWRGCCCASSTTSGRITLGGADLRQLDSTALYRHIGFVLQDVRLIHASVRDNIALGRPSASQAEIEDAARTANIHERILALRATTP